MASLRSFLQQANCTPDNIKCKNKRFYVCPSVVDKQYIYDNDHDIGKLLKLGNGCIYTVREINREDERDMELLITFVAKL